MTEKAEMTSRLFLRNEQKKVFARFSPNSDQCDFVNGASFRFGVRMSSDSIGVPRSQLVLIFFRKTRIASQMGEAPIKAGVFFNREIECSDFVSFYFLL